MVAAVMRAGDDAGMPWASDAMLCAPGAGARTGVGAVMVLGLKKELREDMPTGGWFFAAEFFLLLDDEALLPVDAEEEAALDLAAGVESLAAEATGLAAGLALAAGVEAAVAAEGLAAAGVAGLWTAPVSAF